MQRAIYWKESGIINSVYLPIFLQNTSGQLLHDSLTRLIVNTHQKWPSVFSNCKFLIINQEGSVDIRFGPIAPVENNYNFIQTIPGRRWLMILRLYGPTEAWFDKSWKPDEIEEVKQLSEKISNKIIF